MPQSGVLWLVAAVVGLGSLLKKYCIVVTGVVKVQNGQGEHQSQKLEFPEGPKGTIQVYQTRIASRRKTGLGNDGITERKPQLDRYTGRSKTPLMTLCLIAKSGKNPAEIGKRTSGALAL